MSEAQAIANAIAPRTRSSLANDLRQLGLQIGSTVLVHTSLSSLGWVAGGAVAVIQALQDVLTTEGTLVMPAFSGQMTEPSKWENPPVPAHWWPIIHAETPAFDPILTPTRGIGIVAEQFRTWPKVYRSNHPHSSFSAWGKHACQIIEQHSLALSLGEHSPLARLYELEAKVLLLGTHRNSSLHLAEARSGVCPIVQQGASIQLDGKHQWITFEEYAYDEETFPVVKHAFNNSGAVHTGQVGSATAQLMSQPELVDFAVQWWKKHGRDIN